MAIGTGRIVRSPWITSNPNRSRDAEPVALDREPLQPVGLGRIGDEQQRPDLPLAERRLDHGRLLAEVEVRAPGLGCARWRLK